MSSEAALAFASLWLTYLIRSAGAYLLLWVLCRLIQNSHVRFRLCGIFLGGMVAAWLGLLLLPSLSALFASDSVRLPIVAAPHWSWPLNSALVPLLTTVLSRAPWVYVAVLTLLFLQFCSPFWQLRALLRASQPPSEPLSFLFESIRSGTKARRCELRLVPGLRSPAATGWWRPKVLLPSELLHRLEAQQLVYVLRHELMHVRRRDYLWDRLATLGCYVVFFHPSAWLVRRRLRWERELVCDDCVVDRTGERRLEYGFLAIAALTLGVWLVPEVGVTLSWSVPPNLAKTERLPLFPQPTARINRKRVSKRHTLFATVATSAVESRSAPPNLEFPINLPVLSSRPVVQNYQFSEPAASVSPVGSGSSGELDTESRSTGSIWDESPPHTPAHRASKIGHVAESVVRVGVAVVGLRIGGHEHEKEP